MPKSLTTEPEQASYTDIDTISDNFMAYMGELTPPYLTWPTTTATSSASEAPYAGVVNILYNKTCRLLEESKQDGNKETSQELVSIEHTQAWLLLAHYESLRVNEWQAMLTAGYVFRLIQMAHLHEIDAPEKTSAHVVFNSEPNDEWAATEERRRTFWVAYNLDCFLSWRSEWPLTLYEDMVSTRLAAPEANFQSSQPIPTDSLPEVLTKDTSTILSPFAECVVLATVHSRCMAHRRASSTERDKEPRGFWGRHEWLASAIERRIKLLVQTPAITTIERDPMLFFTHTLAYSAIICLGGTVQRMPWQAAEQQLMAPAYEQRISSAIAEIVRLVKGLPSLSYFKAHPSLPNLLSSAISFLLTQCPTQYDQADIEVLLCLLKDLRDVNSLALKICSTYDGAHSSVLLRCNR
ncbi:hypothetical protein MMC13_000929 [Lambiella insularis]|nr:hypothetical protein [Lambiella insularis]